MKTTFITTGIALLVSIVMTAQTPPTPPKTNVSVHSDETSSSYSYSVSTDDDKNTHSNVSFSINDNSNSYRVNAKFSQGKQKEIKSVISQEINNSNHTFSKNKHKWEFNSNDNEVYRISLSKNRLSLFLDKEIASLSLQEKFKNLGLTLRTIIVGESNSDESHSSARLQRDAEKLRRDSDRMQREAERLRREADRLEREAERLNQE